MPTAAEKNKQSWNEGAAAYDALMHSDRFMKNVLSDPSKAFHHGVWKTIQTLMPDIHGKRICVPSSGDNLAVFAFAILGARVTSCDIAENQLTNAKKISDGYDWGRNIEYICTDTMKLDGIPDDTYDFVYTSNGVHVWINDLFAMYKNICRIMRAGGVYMMYDIHPMLRPFDNDLKIEKPYDMTGPFESKDEVTFAWRVMDIMNAMLDAGLTVRHIEELFTEKNYEWPFWISLTDLENGVTVPREEVDRMFDWRNNPMMALPSWISITANK